MIACLAGPLLGQELAPDSYSISPVGVNALVFSSSLQSGDVAFDASAPIEDADATIGVSVLAFARSLDIAGRSAGITIAQPYVVGDLKGTYIGQFSQVHRSGLGDSRFRLAVNLIGGPAMNLKEFVGYRQKTNVGVSFSVVAPTGQYDPEKLINLGTNRWSFKPEIGVSHKLGKWTLEGYGGVWLFTDNDSFYGGKLRDQEPIGSTQFHLTYTFRSRFWVAFNTNFYFGGRTSVDGKENFDLLKNSRIGATLSIPLNRRQSVKVAFSSGAYTTIGADFTAAGVSYQYIWGAGL
jgi:Putative MetA-pathway of phenol degradation